LGVDPPGHAVLPPNALTVYGLRDAAGYDSLFPGVYKQRVREAGDGLDPSPPENGNIVFIKSAAIAQRLGARYVVTAPNAPARFTADAPGLRQEYAGPDLTIYAVDPAASARAPAATLAPREGLPVAYRATSFRVGLFAGLCAVGTLMAALLASAAAW
jgi:hypothetical protein